MCLSSLGSAKHYGLWFASGLPMMMAKEFMNAVCNGKRDLIQLLLDVLAETGSAYCVIDGIGVNAYADPVVSLDLDLVVAAKSVERVTERAVAQGLKVEEFTHSVNLSSNESDLRIQIQTDERYQSFISGAQDQTVLGYSMKVASIEDLLRGKTWAYRDRRRRPSKRQKDLADIIRLVEVRPDLEEALPPDIRERIRELN